MTRKKLKAAKRQARNPDFKKLKRKVGKTAPRAANATRVDFTVKRIGVPLQQAVVSDKGSVVTTRNLSLKDLTSQVKHHNAKVRADAFLGLKELTERHAFVLEQDLSAVLEPVAAGICDVEPAVRRAVMTLLRAIVPRVPEVRLAPFLRLLMVYVNSAMSHMAADVQSDALGFLHCIVSQAPRLVWPYAQEVFVNLRALLTRRRGVRGSGAAASGGGARKRKRRATPEKTVSIFDCLALMLAQHPALSASPQVQGGVSAAAAAAAELHRVVAEPLSARSFVLGGKGATELSKETEDFVPGYIGDVFPALLECWLESFPTSSSGSARKRGRGGAGNLGRLPSHTLASMASILTVLRNGLEILHAQMSAEELEQVTRQWRRRFAMHVFTSFPLSRSSGAEVARIDEINLLMCEVMRFFIYGEEGDEEDEEEEEDDDDDVVMDSLPGWQRRLFEFIGDVLRPAPAAGSSTSSRSRQGGDARARQEQVLPLLPVLKQVLVHVPEARQDDFVERLFALYESCHVRSRTKAECLGFFIELLEADGARWLAHRFAQDWVATLPAYLVHLSTPSEQRSLDYHVPTCRRIVRLIHRVVRRFSAVVDARELLLGCLPVVLSPQRLAALPRDVSEQLVALLYYVPELDMATVAGALQCCRALLAAPETAALGQFAAQTVAQRAADIEPAAYVSFLVSLLFAEKVQPLPEDVSRWSVEYATHRLSELGLATHQVALLLSPTLLRVAREFAVGQRQGRHAELHALVQLCAWLCPLNEALSQALAPCVWQLATQEAGHAWESTQAASLMKSSPLLFASVLECAAAEAQARDAPERLVALVRALTRVVSIPGVQPHLLPYHDEVKSLVERVCGMPGANGMSAAHRLESEFRVVMFRQ